MLELTPPVIAAQQLDPHLFAITLGAPGLAAAAHPGQFVAARPLQGAGAARIHRIGVSLAGIDRDAGTVGLLLDRDHRGWGPGDIRVGDTINLLGPLGHGWTIEPAARQLLLVGTVATVGSLLVLAVAALRQQRAVTLVLGGQIGPGLPAGVVPAAVEYHLGRGPDPAGAALELLDDAMIRWADAIYTTLPAVTWPTLAQRLERTRMRWQRGFAQVDVGPAGPCAVGVCGACEMHVGRKTALACLEGPVFDLRDLTRS